MSQTDEFAASSWIVRQAARRRKMKSYLCIQILMVTLMIILTPFLSFSVELIHTIQIGSHLTGPRAMRQYGSVLDMLKEEDRSYLRIEKMGDYYALRIGSFTTSRDAEDLLMTLNSVYPDAMIMTAYISKNKLVKMYRSGAVEMPFQTNLELKEVPTIVPEAEMAGPQLVETEEFVPAILELKEKPAMVSEAGLVVPQLIEIEEPVPADLEMEEEPATVPEEGKVVPQLAEVEESAPVSPVKVKAQDVIVEVTTPINSVVGGEKAVAKVDESFNTISSRQLITYVSVLTLIMLALYIRSRKAALKNGPSAEMVEDSDEPAEELYDSGKVRWVEVPGTDQEDGPFLQDTVGAVKNIEVSLAEKEVETTEAEENLSVSAETATTDLPKAEGFDNKEDSPVGPLQESRGKESIEPLVEESLDEDEEILDLVDKDILDEEPLADSAIVTAAAPETAITESTHSQGTFGDDNREGNFVEERPDTSDAGVVGVAELIEETDVEKTEAGKSTTDTATSAATNLPNADIQDNKEKSTVNGKERQGNRMSNAVEAVMLGAKNKR